MKESNNDKEKKEISKPSKNSSDALINDVTSSEYKYGFVTNIDTDIIPQGLNEDVLPISPPKTHQ